MVSQVVMLFVIRIIRTKNSTLVVGEADSNPQGLSHMHAASNIPSLACALNSTSSPLLVDVRHLPGVERFLDGGGALGS